MQRPKWVAPDDADAMRARREAIFTRGTGMFLCPKRRDHSVAMLGEGITLYFDVSALAVPATALVATHPRCARFHVLPPRSICTAWPACFWS